MLGRLYKVTGIALLCGGIILCRYGLHKIDSLTKQNAELTKTCEELNMALAGEIERATRVERAVQRLEEHNSEREAQLRQFESRLRVLSSDNRELHELLSVTIPDELLFGLHSFTPLGTRSDRAHSGASADAADTSRGDRSSGDDTGPVASGGSV